MSTKTLGVVLGGSGRQKVGTELGSNDFYPNSIPAGDVPNFCRIYKVLALGVKLLGDGASQGILCVIGWLFHLLFTT